MSFVQNFDIDMGKIIAKLHLAASQALPNKTVINTAIINDSKNPDPNKPGDASFDLNQESKRVIIVYDIENVQYPIIESYDKKLKDLEEKKKSNPTDTKIDEEIKKRKDEILKINETRTKNNQQTLKRIQNVSYKDMKQYYDIFVGKDSIKKLTMENILLSECNPEFDKDKIGDNIEKSLFEYDKTKKQQELEKDPDAKMNIKYVAITNYEYTLED